jgi:hypothetical protein
MRQFNWWPLRLFEHSKKKLGDKIFSLFFKSLLPLKKDLSRPLKRVFIFTSTAIIS